MAGREVGGNPASRRAPPRDRGAGPGRGRRGRLFVEAKHGVARDLEHSGPPQRRLVRFLERQNPRSAVGAEVAQNGSRSKRKMLSARRNRAAGGMPARSSTKARSPTAPQPLFRGERAVVVHHDRQPGRDRSGGPGGEGRGEAGVGDDVHRRDARQSADRVEQVVEHVRRPPRSAAWPCFLPARAAGA